MSRSLFQRESNVRAGHFPTTLVHLCDTIHRECLRVVSSLIEDDKRSEYPEAMTLALSTSQLAHTHLTLLNLDSPIADSTKLALAELCDQTSMAIEALPAHESRTRLRPLLETMASRLRA